MGNKAALFILIIPVLFSFTKKATTDFMAIVFDFDTNSTVLIEKMKKGLANYYQESLTDTLTNPNEMSITLYPEEEKFYAEKNLEKYMKRGNNLIKFIRTELNFKGNLSISFMSTNQNIDKIDCQISMGHYNPLKMYKGEK